jgi:pilus assembly protein CpaE
MSESSHILLLSSDIPVADAVREALAKDAGLSSVELTVTARSSDFEAELARLQPEVALLDVDLDWAVVFALLDKLGHTSPQTRPLLLCTHLTTQLALDAMQSGARHCLEKASLSAELATVLQRFLGEIGRAPAMKGKLITVVGAAGGCGATSLAVHLAHEAGHAGEAPSLIVDLDLAYGGVASHLGLDARYGIADVLNAESQVEVGMVESTAAVFDSRLHALVSPASTDPGESLSPSFSNLSAALTAFRQAYALTVIDAPRLSADLTARIAQVSEATLLVFQADVVGVRTARAIRSALVARGVELERIFPVVTRYHKRHCMLQLSDVQDAFKEVKLLQVRNDWDAASRSINLGRPLSQVAPRSHIRRDVQEVLEHALPTQSSSGLTASRRPQ